MNSARTNMCYIHLYSLYSVISFIVCSMIGHFCMFFLFSIVLRVWIKGDDDDDDRCVFQTSLVRSAKEQVSSLVGGSLYTVAKQRGTEHISNW